MTLSYLKQSEFPGLAMMSDLVTFVHFFAIVIQKTKKEHCHIITVFLQRFLSWYKSTPKHTSQWERSTDTFNLESRHLNQSNAA